VLFFYSPRFEVKEQGLGARDRHMNDRPVGRAVKGESLFWQCLTAGAFVGFPDHQKVEETAEHDKE